MKIEKSTSLEKITVTFSEQEYHAVAASVKTAAADRSRRQYEYDHHYGISLTGMKALSSKLNAAGATKKAGRTAARSAHRKKVP